MGKIEELEKRIKQLEDKLNKTQQSFGRSYNSVGSSDSDYLIKTKGQVKIQYGNKFINLIKDGKINVDSKLIFQSDSVGTKDGIYVLSDGSIILKVRNQQIELTTDSGATYVSFMLEQETTPEQKQIALKNIGFVYESLDLLDGSEVQNGIIYVTSENALYTIINGEVQKYNVSIPNPYTEQIILQKVDSKEGAIVIQGSGIKNSLKFDTLTIYSDTESYLESKDAIHFFVDNQRTFIVDKTGIISKVPLSIQELYSEEHSETQGFWLFIGGTDKKSYLYVDNLTVRGALDATVIQDIYSEYYWYLNNIITNITTEIVTDDEGNEITIYVATLKYQQEYLKDQILVSYFIINNVLTKVELTVYNVDGRNVGLTFNDDKFFENNPDTSYSELIGKHIFIKNGLKTSQKGLEFYVEQDLDSVIGDISNTNKSMQEEDQLVPLSGNGLYSNRAFFTSAAYTSDYILSDNDSSSKFASTEWINKNALPSGTIVLWSGDSNNIPKGWQLCDGTNGTPNLIDRIVIGASQKGISGSYNVETSESTTTMINWIYLAYIMKI